MSSDGHRAPQGSPQVQIDANENHFQVTPKVNLQPPHDNENHFQVTPKVNLQPPHVNENHSQITPKVKCK